MREVKHVHEGAKNMKLEFWNQTPMSVPHKPHYFLTLKKQTASFILQRQQRETKQKLGKHALLQTKRQSHDRLTFPSASVRREKNMRVPKVLAAGALGKKHLQILFCRKWNKRPRNSSSVPPDERKQWRWSCDVLVESVFSCFFLFFSAVCLSFSPSFFLFTSFTFQWRLFSIKEKPSLFLLVLPLSPFCSSVFLLFRSAEAAYI